MSQKICHNCQNPITNALGKCFLCEEEKHRNQEPWEPDEDYSDIDFEPEYYEDEME